MPTEACLEEFEALSAIFLDEIQIGEEESNGSAKISMVLYPATGDDQESKYVTLTLELTLPAEYPKVSPIIRFRNPRGLSESLLDSLYRNMIQCCSDRLESQMIFELIDMGKEFLTINNRPASECPICLLSFTSCDTFFRSQCFHHFHSYCLGRYLQNVMQALASGEHLPGDAPEKTCPVCREKLDEDIDVQKLLDSPRPFEESLEVVDGEAILKEWHGQQEKLKTLFDKQKSQGGIIDLSEIEKKRLVISSPRSGGDGGDSPSSSSDVNSAVEGEMVLLQATGANNDAGGGMSQISLNRSNPRSETRSKAPGKEISKDKSSVNVNPPPSQNSQVKSSVVTAKSGQPAQSDAVAPPTRTSPTLGRHASSGKQGFHGRGKGSYHGNSRRRYK